MKQKNNDVIYCRFPVLRCGDFSSFFSGLSPLVSSDDPATSLPRVTRKILFYCIDGVHRGRLFVVYISELDRSDKSAWDFSAAHAEHTRSLEFNGFLKDQQIYFCTYS